MLAAEKTFFVTKNNATVADGKTVILGLGKSGVSAARFLRARGEAFIALDTRPQPPGMQELQGLLPKDWLRLGEIEQTELNSAATIILSPGLSIELPYIAEAKQNGVQVIGDIELFARHADAPVVAITGSNGKTTVTSLLGQMARDAGLDVRVGGNIGTPALDLLTSGSDNAPDFYILELSSFQLETTYSLQASLVTILNISPDHMDRYNNVEDYAQAKHRIYHGQGSAVLNKQEVTRWGQAYVPGATDPRRPIYFGLGHPGPGEFGIAAAGDTTHNRCASFCFGDEVILPVADLKLLGTHNQQNVLAALALGYGMGLSFTDMARSIAAFTGLPHRTQWVARHNEVTWINDSKGTNVGATVAALQGLPGNKILIAGGDAKGADFSELRIAVSEQDVELVVLFGRDAELIEQALRGAVQTARVDGLQAAIEMANRCAQPGWIVLFSPACASFDMFANYEQRGEIYTQSVKEMLSCT